MNWKIRTIVAMFSALLHFPAQAQTPQGPSQKFSDIRYAHFMTLKCGFLTREQTAELEEYTRRLYIAGVTSSKEAPAKMSALDDEVKQRSRSSSCDGKLGLVRSAHLEAAAYAASRDASYYDAAIDIGKRCSTITPDQVSAIQKKKLEYDDRVTAARGAEFLSYYRGFLQISRTAFQALPCTEGPKLLNWAMSGSAK